MGIYIYTSTDRQIKVYVDRYTDRRIDIHVDRSIQIGRCSIYRHRKTDKMMERYTDRQLNKSTAFSEPNRTLTHS